MTPQQLYEADNGPPPDYIVHRAQQNSSGYYLETATVIPSTNKSSGWIRIRFEDGSEKNQQINAHGWRVTEIEARLDVLRKACLTFRNDELAPRGIIENLKSAIAFVENVRHLPDVSLRQLVASDEHPCETGET